MLGAECWRHSSPGTRNPHRTETRSKQRLSESVLLVGQQGKLLCCNKRPQQETFGLKRGEEKRLLKNDEGGRGSRLAAQQVQRLEWHGQALHSSNQRASLAGCAVRGEGWADTSQELWAPPDGTGLSPQAILCSEDSERKEDVSIWALRPGLQAPPR